MKNLLASWFRSLTAFESGPIQNEYSVVDPTSAKGDSLSTVILAVDPSTDGQSPTMVSLRFNGSGVKLFEKKYASDGEAQTEMQSMANDLQEAADLSKTGKTEEAKNLMNSLIEKYKRHSDNLTQPSVTPTMTQASQELSQYKGWKIHKAEDERWMAEYDVMALYADSIDTLKAKIDNMVRKAKGKQLKQAGITMQNLFFDTTDEAMEYQEKMKALQGPEGGEGKPLWEQMGKEEVAPSNESATPEEDNELAPPSLSFDRIEKSKAKEDKDIGKRIKDQVKTEVESALEQKSASVFGSDQEELVDALRKNGRNWDEIKKIFTKELSYNEDDTTVFLDSIRQKEEGGAPEGLPLPPKPPEDLVSPETHDKLVKEIEDKTEVKPELKPELPKPLEDEIARADNAEIRKVAAHTLKIKSLDDAMADCSEGDWHYVRTGPATREHIEKEFKKHTYKEASKKVALQLWQSSSNYMGDDYSDYYVGPSKGYDADALAKSNYKVALEMLGGPSNEVLDGHFKSWAGDFDVILVHKDAADKVAILQDIENKIKEYPVLNEDDYSNQEWADYEESYSSWARDTALGIIEEHLHEQNPELKDTIKDIELTPEIEKALFRAVMDTLSYAGGDSVEAKELLENESIGEVINYFREKLGMGADQKYVPENPNQMKLFETSLRRKIIVKAIHKRALNPLQEPPAVGQNPGQPLAAPVEENPTFDSPVPPSQDTNPEPEFLEAPQAGDRVYVMGDYETGQDGFEGMMVSDYTSKGDEYAVIAKDDGDNAEVALHRVVKASQKKVAQVYYEKKAKHEHTYQKGKSDSVVTCPCGAFKFTEEYLKENPPITEKKAAVTDSSRGRNWKVTYYDKNDKVISSHTIKDRTEAEAEKEATGDMPSGCDDWSMVPVKEKKAALNKKADTTTDLSQFGHREREMARELLNAWHDQGLPEDFYDDQVTIMMNTDSGNVFLTNADYQVAMLNGPTLESFYSCPYCGHEGFKDEMLHEPKDEECTRYMQEIGVLQQPTKSEVLKEHFPDARELPLSKSNPEDFMGMPQIKSDLQFLHESALKLRAELEREGEIAIYFHKEGIDKQAAGDSAFEGNGWCRVWIQDTEIESDKRYPEILKLADETARVDALKDLARDLAHEALRLADSAAGKVGVQAWFESLHPSDHDRIDWDALANPQPENVESSQEPKIEKKADEPLLGPSGQPLPAKPETPTQFKQLEKAPAKTQRELAQPASEEQAKLIAEMQSSLSSLASIQSMVAQAKAKLNEEIKNIEQSGGRVQIESELKAKMEKLSKLVEATQNQMVYAGETMVRLVQDIKEKPFKPNDAWKVQKLVEKFAGAQEYLDKAIAGAQSLATTEQVRDLVFFPRKVSKLHKSAGFMETLDSVYNDVMEALKLIISSEEQAEPAVV